MGNDLRQQHTSSVAKIRNALSASWSHETSYFDDWSPSNPSAGQCAVSAIIVQDYLGGEIKECAVNGIVHYFNVVEGAVLDITAGQFGSFDIDYAASRVKTKDEILRYNDTRRRYELLKAKVEDFFGDLEAIAQQEAAVDYGGMGVAHLEGQSIWFGEDNDIVLVGEAPARNGWLKSGVAWHDPQGKLLPSGVVMQKLLRFVDRELLAITFLEAIQCFPADRKYLGRLAELYRPTLLRRLAILRPKVVLTLGDIPTRAVLGWSFGRLSDVVGQRLHIEGMTVVPIFHPSPISPRSYNGNVPIFEQLRKEVCV